MRGRYPLAYRLKATERRYLEQVASDGQVLQRVAKRAQALLALDRGERIMAIVHWTGVRRTGLWRLWRRYLVTNATFCLLFARRLVAGS